MRQSLRDFRDSVIAHDARILRDAAGAARIAYFEWGPGIQTTMDGFMVSSADLSERAIDELHAEGVYLGNASTKAGDKEPPHRVASMRRSGSRPARRPRRRERRRRPCPRAIVAANPPEAIEVCVSPGRFRLIPAFARSRGMSRASLRVRFRLVACDALSARAKTIFTVLVPPRGSPALPQLIKVLPQLTIDGRKSFSRRSAQTSSATPMNPVSGHNRD